MSHLRLDSQAAAMLKQVQLKAGPMTAQVEQAIIAACQTQAPGEARLNAAQLEQVLITAMPQQQQVIGEAKAHALCYHPDNTNGRFLTQILATRVVKESVEAVVSRPPAPRIRDPYHASFNIDPKADFVLLFNARDVDRNGQPLLMKVIARERADLSKLDLSRYRTQPDNTPDVMKIKDNADFVEMKDVHETEFTFGDPLKQVSMNSDGKEISTSVRVRPENENIRTFYPGRRVGTQFVPDTSRPKARADVVTTGDQLDNRPVVTFGDRIHLKLAAKPEMPPGTWLDGSVGSFLDAELGVDRGYMFEPGSKANIKFMDASVDVGVPADDAQLLGSGAGAAKVNLNSSLSLRQILSQPLTQKSSASTTASDAANTSTAAVDLIYANKAKLSVGAGALQPLADTTLKQDGFAAAKISVDKRPLEGDPEHDGQHVHLTLGEGFLAAQEDASVKGWKMVVGFTDETGAWQAAEPRVVGGEKASGAESFSFDLKDADEAHRKDLKLEVRVFNADGVPAQRVIIPFREVGWAADV